MQQQFYDGFQVIICYSPSSPLLPPPLPGVSNRTFDFKAVEGPTLTERFLTDESRDKEHENLLFRDRNLI